MNASLTSSVVSTQFSAEAESEPSLTYSVGGSRVALPCINFCLRAGLSRALSATPSWIAFDMVDVKYAASIGDAHDPWGTPVCTSFNWSRCLSK